jgi:hypothetical protein
LETVEMVQVFRENAKPPQSDGKRGHQSHRQVSLALQGRLLKGKLHGERTRRLPQNRNIDPDLQAARRPHVLGLLLRLGNGKNS